MFDHDTIRICREFAPLISEPDAIEQEYMALRANQIQAQYFRRVCQHMGLSTKLDIAMPYKGRTYYSLQSHPLVRRKNRRMRELKTILRGRGTLERLDQMTSRKTAHWFNRRVA